MTPFDWRTFLHLANWLGDRPADDGSSRFDDAALRTVISRSYYAAFHVARTFVETEMHDGALQWPLTRRSLHDTVWDSLSSHPDPEVAALAAKGIRLKQQRTEADYSIAPHKGRRAIAIHARHFAQEIITKIDEVRSTGTQRSVPEPNRPETG